VTSTRTSREVAVWAGVVSIATGAACLPFLVLGSDRLRVVLILALSIITQLVSGGTLLVAAWAARDTDRLVDD
jgi:hypothetical protein